MKFSTKRALATLAGLALFTAAAIWLWPERQEVTLFDLQKRYLFAQTDAERENVADELERYFLNLPVPDTIRQNVEQAVQAALDTTNIDPKKLALDHNEPNVYVLEGQITNALKTAMIARARGDDSGFQEIMSQLWEVARIADEGLHSDYWMGFIGSASRFNRENAVAWLQAEKAERLCHGNNTKYRFLLAADCGALGLKYLQQAADPRLRLTLIQRFQIILHHYYGLNDLSIILAKRYVAQAEQMHHHLRAIGLAFNRAEAVYNNGETARSLELFQQIITSARKYQAVPYMSWFEINAQLMAANAYWQLGMYKEAQALCEKAQKLGLSNYDEIMFYNTRGLVERRLGNYDEAESLYRRALGLAQSDTMNQIAILGNLGFMYYELTEYEWALRYYERAHSLLGRFNPENYEQKINILIDIAKIMSKKGRHATADTILDQAQILIAKSGTLPWRQADLLFTLGKVNLEIGEDEGRQVACTYFQRADSICEKYGLLRLGLSVKLDYSSTLIHRGRNSEARHWLNNALTAAQIIGEKEKAIDARALLATIEAQEGNYERAVEISDSVLDDIETLSHQFGSLESLIAYRQKIYDYLKDAIFYEICNQRSVSAFEKLVHAKAAALRMQNRVGDFAKDQRLSFSGTATLHELQGRLDEHSLVIDYLLMPDTLYAFVLNRSGLQVFRKESNLEILKSTVYAYRDSINSTIRFFRENHDVKAIDEHFEATTQLGRQLYHDLFGWPELRARLQSHTLVYIIPDEFLHEVSFATLVMERPDSTVFLIEKVAVVNLPSASLLQSQGANGFALDVQNRKLLLSANAQMPDTQEFVAEIKQQFPLAEVLQVDRTVVEKNDVLAAMSDGQEIYIFSGHSVANAVDPDLSFIEVSVLNAASQTAQTMQMQWTDLKTLDWSGTELVLLLGCETAAGKLYRGNGISGLQQGFLSLGAQCVLATLWRIDAAQSLQQARGFLKEWISKKNPALALREMQLQTIQRLQQHQFFRRPHPYFWGAYILTAKTV